MILLNKTRLLLTFSVLIVSFTLMTRAAFGQNWHLLPENAGKVLELDKATKTEIGNGKVKFSQRSENELLIVGVVIDDTILDEGFLIYLDDNNQMLIPVGALAKLLEFSINVDVESGTISGWFVREEQMLKTIYPFENYELLGKHYTYDQEDIIEVNPDDIYVSESLIKEWFPLQINFNFNELRMYLKATEELPFQSRVKRRQVWKKIPPKIIEDKNKIDEDVIELPGKLYSLPSIEVHHTLGVTDTNGENKYDSAHFIGLNSEVFYMNARSSINVSTDSKGKNEFKNTLFTLSKTDYDGNIGGILNATDFKIGDTNSYNFALASSQQRGRGAQITNKPKAYVRDTNDFIIDGYASYGWDVELYQNGRLIDFQTVGNDGRYKFDTLPLNTGFNLFRIVLYGPNGQKENRFEKFYIGRNMVEPGEFVYEGSFLESSTPLIDLKEDKTPETGSTLTLMGDYGLNKNISANLGYFQGYSSDTLLKGVGGGVRASGNSMFIQVNTFNNFAGGKSLNLDLIGSLSKTLSWSLNGVKHKDYKEGVRTIVEKVSGSISHELAFKKLPRLSYKFGVTRKKDEDETTRTVYESRLSTTLLGMNLTNVLQRKSYSGHEDIDVPGILTFKTRIPSGDIRGRLNYSLDGQADLDSLQLQLQNRLSPKLTLNTSLSSDLTTNIKNTYQAKLDYQADKYRFGLEGSYQNNGVAKVGLNFVYNFLPQSRSGNYKMTGFSQNIHSGIVLVEPFIDENQDGIKNKNEKTVQDLKFRNMLRGVNSETTEEGFESLSGIASNVVNKIQVKEGSITDIYLSPGKKYISVLGRKGVNGPIPYPIYQLGEFSGTIKYKNLETDEFVPIQNLYMALIDKNDDVIAEAFSEFDGFFAFTSVPIGSYTLFIPSSEVLVSLDLYHGDGFGPKILLSSEEPELFSSDIIIKSNSIEMDKN